MEVLGTTGVSFLISPLNLCLEASIREYFLLGHGNYTVIANGFVITIIMCCFNWQIGTRCFKK